MMKRGPKPRPVLERWLAYVDKTETCWLWIGALSPAGYGQFSGGWAHRFAYELLVGPIPEGLQIDHLCRVRNCVNPDHLEPVTARENVRRGRAARGQVRTARAVPGAAGHDGYIGYTRGCRCDTCRAAKADYVRQKRAEARATTVDGIAAIERHGTRTGYQWHGCRCDDCAAANAAAARRQYAARRSA